MPGRTKKKRRDDPQIACPDDAHPRVPLVLGAEHPLHHVLAGTAVPDADGEEAGEDAGDREPLVRRRQKDLKLVGVFVHQRGEAADAREAQHGNQHARRAAAAPTCMKSVHAAEVRPP